MAMQKDNMRIERYIERVSGIRRHWSKGTDVPLQY